MQEEITADDRREENHEESNNRFSFFIPQKNYFATPVLIYINLLVFAAMVLSGVSLTAPEIADLISWGANFRHSIAEGETWRLFSSQFVHIGMVHLGLNLYALFYIGFLLEPVIGTINFSVFYLLAGLTGSINSIYWNDFTVSAGASGAIFGMYGFFLVLLLTRLIAKTYTRELLYSMLFFIGFNLLSGLSSDSGIDNAAHLGGLIGGGITGLLYYSLIRLNTHPRFIPSVGMILIMALWFFSKSELKKLPDPMGEFEQVIADFSQIEKEIIDAINAVDQNNRPEVLSVLKECMGKWENAKKVLDRMNDYHLPNTIIDKISLLRQYADNRIMVLQLYSRGLKENTSQYDLEIQRLNEKKEEMLQKFQ